MTAAFDPRIIIVSILIDGNLQVFQSDGTSPGLDIRCEGQKFASPESAICTMRISNLTRAQKNFIMTRGSPMTLPNNPDRQPIPVTLDVGRKSFGTFRLFEGTCWASAVTAPPDITITLTSTTNNLAASIMTSYSSGALAPISVIAANIASTYGLTLNNTATDKNIANFHYTGGLQTAINKLARAGNLRVHVDNNILNVYNIGKARGNAQNFTLSLQTNMVGIPEVIQSGCKARMLIRPEPQIGGPITINSVVNPAVNGAYTISTMNYNLATRDDPFWYELLCDNTLQFQGGQ